MVADLCVCVWGGGDHVVADLWQPRVCELRCDLWRAVWEPTFVCGRARACVCVCVRACAVWFVRLRAM